MAANQAGGRTKWRPIARIAAGVAAAIVVATVTVWFVSRTAAPEPTALPRPDQPVATTTLEDDGVVGELWLPVELDDPVVGVVVLGGSEGGMSSAWLAGAFASEGIAAFNVALFDHPGLPDRLLDIPLEQVVAGVEYVRSRPEVDDDRVWLVGGSRGSEAAMLTAIAHPGLVDGVVAAVPGSAAVCGIPCDGPAWTIDGEGVPSTRMLGATEPFDRPEAAIPVQDLEARLVTVCGGEDDVWPSCRHARALEERRVEADVAGQDRHFTYEEAGHEVGWLAHTPRILPAHAFGEVDEEARRDLWPQLIEVIQAEEPPGG